MKAFLLFIPFVDLSSNFESKLFFVHLIKQPLDTIQSFSLVAASNIDILKLDDRHEELDVDVDDKWESFCNAYRNNNWNVDM